MSPSTTIPFLFVPHRLGVPRLHVARVLVCAACSMAASCAPGAQQAAPTEPCEPGFVQQVVSVRYGDGAGFGQSRMPDVVFGPPRGGGSNSGSTDVVSLGLGGEIVLGFGAAEIADREGDDFIVFENAFRTGAPTASAFVELGEVSVSTDGVEWITFPCDVSAADPLGCAGRTPVLANPENGLSPFDPHVAGGDAFDLSSTGVQSARFVRIVSRGGQPSAAGSSGFDLDAVANVHPVCF